MIRYHFDGVNADGKKVGGFLFAEDEGTARAKLKGNGYAVLTLTPYVEESKEDTQMSTFEFRGKNTDNAFVQGKIQANDPYAAYKKLRTEYKLELEYLIPTGLSPLETHELKQRGIDPDMVELYDEEFKVKKKGKKKEEGIENRVGALTEKRQQKMDFYRESIEKVIQDVTEILQHLEGRISYEEHRDLKERLDNLARLRASNSIEHLDHLVRKLFEKLRNLQTLEGIDSATKDLLSKSVGGLSEKFDKGMKTMELNLSFINTDEIKKTIVDLKVVSITLNTLYWIFVFLAVFCVGTWLYLLLKGLFTGFDQFVFFWKSGVFLFFSSLSCLVVGMYFPLLFRSEAWDKRQRVLYSVMTGLIWVIYLIEFPVLFFWA